MPSEKSLHLKRISLVVVVFLVLALFVLTILGQSNIKSVEELGSEKDNLENIINSNQQ